MDMKTVTDTSVQLKNNHSKDSVGYGFGATLQMQSSEMYTCLSFPIRELMSSCDDKELFIKCPSESNPATLTQQT